MARSPYNLHGLPKSTETMLRELQEAEQHLQKAWTCLDNAKAQADKYGTLRDRIGSIANAVYDIDSRLEGVQRKVAETWIEKGIAL